MTPDERQFHVARLSTPSAGRVLDALGAAGEPVRAADLAAVAQVSISATREVLARAHKLNLVVQHVAPGKVASRWSLTTGGWDHLAGLRSLYAPASVNDVDASAIDHDDRPSSTTMTPTRDRRGKPGWCTPGVGACKDCKET